MEDQRVQTMYEFEQFIQLQLGATKNETKFEIKPTVQQHGVEFKDQ